MRLVRKQDLTYALRRYDPQRDGRFGEFLITDGVLTQEALDRALKQQALLAKVAA